MTHLAKQLIDQFNTALGKVSSEEQLVVQRQVADLLLSSTAPYSERQVAIFNDVMNGLIERIDRPALLELIGRLAAADHAPSAVIGRLSSNEDITIAGPMLEQSKVLTDEDTSRLPRPRARPTSWPLPAARTSARSSPTPWSIAGMWTSRKRWSPMTAPASPSLDS